jgi:hypothetical protein
MSSDNLSDSYSDNSSIEHFRHTRRSQFSGGGGFARTSFGTGGGRFFGSSNISRSFRGGSQRDASFRRSITPPSNIIRQQPRQQPPRQQPPRQQPPRQQPPRQQPSRQQPPRQQPPRQQNSQHKNDRKNRFDRKNHHKDRHHHNYSPDYRYSNSPRYSSLGSTGGGPYWGWWYYPWYTYLHPVLDYVPLWSSVFDPVPYNANETGYEIEKSESEKSEESKRTTESSDSEKKKKKDKKKDKKRDKKKKEIEKYENIKIYPSYK